MSLWQNHPLNVSRNLLLPTKVSVKGEKVYDRSLIKMVFTKDEKWGGVTRNESSKGYGWDG